MLHEEHDVRDLDIPLKGVAVRVDDQDTRCGTFLEGAYGPEERLENLYNT